MIYCLCLVLLGEPFHGVKRTIFDIQLIDGRSIVNAKLALNYLNQDQFSLHLAKSPTGTLFTYWALPDRNVLSFPKQKVAFLGEAEERFSLFADGPKLSRVAWLQLLQTGKYQSLGPWRLHLLDGWYSLHDEPVTFRIRWKERSTSLRKRVSQRVLDPDMASFKNVQPLNTLTGFAWTGL